MIRILAVTLLAFLLLALPAAAQNAGEAWNQVADSYSFGNYPQPASASFADAYFGPPSQLEANLKAALVEVARLMVWTAIPAADPDDEMNDTLENWPEH